MRESRFRVGIHDGADEFRLEAQGKIGSREAKEIERCWRTAEATIGSRVFVLDLRLSSGIEEAAIEDLRPLLDAAEVIASEAMIRRLAGQAPAKSVLPRCLSMLCRAMRALRRLGSRREQSAARVRLAPR